MRLFKYISMVAALFLATGCSDERFDRPNGPVDEGDMLTLNLSVNVGEMSMASTRAFEDQPDYGNLHLYVAEFDDKGGALAGNVLTNVYEAKEETVNTDGDIHFKLTVAKSDQPKVLHLIAVPKGTALSIPYGLEGQVIPTLTVGDETPAYWARVVLASGYGSEASDGTWIPAADLQSSLTHVPMLRNFAKVTMSATAVPAADGFNFTGFVVLNRASRGTVAPWDSQNQIFPAFSNGSRPLGYDAINYSGYCPVNPGEEGSIIGKSATADDFTIQAKYLYERPLSSLDNTVVIFSGTKAGVEGTRYYKLDLGKTGEDMIFRYYNVLRNFDYQINITGVQGNGYGSIEEAMRGVVQNNFSFDITTAQMLNISNGRQMLWVNQTTFVVNDNNNTEFTFKYRFMQDVADQGNYNNAGLKFYTEVDGKNEEGIKTGSVITGVTYNNTPDADGYSSVTITTTQPTDETQEASFIVIDPESGLGRTINVIVRKPWIYGDSFEWAGTYNTRAQFYSTEYPREAEWENAVGTEQGSAFTLFFILEENIPQAMFPLEFVAESRGQNFENNKIGTLFVRSSESLFDKTKTAIQYVKTVSYADYMSALSLKNPTGTIVTDTVTGKSQHRIRLRFLTIRPLTAGYEGSIRVYNRYFKNADGGDYLEYKLNVKNFQKAPWLWDMTSEEKPSNAN